MFNFFRSHDAKKKRRLQMDLYELNERETDMLMGGSPVRQLLGEKSHPSPWMGAGNGGFYGSNHQPFTVAPSPTRWQQSPQWTHIGEENTVNRMYSYNHE